MKKLSPLLIAILSTGSQAALVAHYDMEQATSPIVDQVGGQTASAVDGGQQYSVTGPAGFGNAVGLNANGSWQLSAPGSANINLANNFTVSAWVYVDSALQGGKAGLNPDINRILGDDVDWDADGWSFGIRSSGQLLFTKNGIVDQNDLGAARVPTDAWIHVAAVVSSGTGTTFYINGAANGTDGNTANINTGLGNNGTEDPYGIGRSYGNAQEQWFPGNLDEIKVFDTTLTQPEVAALMVPEPSVTLLAASVLGLAMIRRRR